MGDHVETKKENQKKIRGFTWRKIGKEQQFLPKFDIFIRFKLHKTYKTLLNVDAVTDISQLLKSNTEKPVLPPFFGRYLAI